MHLRIAALERVRDDQGGTENKKWKKDQIVDAFTGWGYSVSPEQVARPTSDFVLGVYSACLEQVTGITLDTLQEPIEQSLASTENPVRR